MRGSGKPVDHVRSQDSETGFSLTHTTINPFLENVLLNALLMGTRNLGWEKRNSHLRSVGKNL